MQQWAQAEEDIKLQKITYDFDALIAAINTGGQDMEDALQTFREAVLPPNPVVLNNYYNIEALLLAAYQAYADKFNDFADWPQRIIFCVKVIGFLQSLVTPEVAKVFCERLYYVVERGQAISERARSLKLKLWAARDGTTNFYRSNNRSSSGLGFEYLSGPVPPTRADAGHASAAFVHGDPLRCWKNYVEQKNQSLQALNIGCRIQAGPV